jgi:hypothetical protein
MSTDGLTQGAHLVEARHQAPKLRARYIADRIGQVVTPPAFEEVFRRGQIDLCAPPSALAHKIVTASKGQPRLDYREALATEEKNIRRTMNGPARITIDTSREYEVLESQRVIRWVMAKARVKEWQGVQYVVIPDNLMLGDMGACLVLAGMRKSQMLIDPEGLWFRGNDGTREYVSVKVDRQALEKLLTPMV